MADINDFIDPKLIKSLEAINLELIKSGKIIDEVVVPAIKKLEEQQRKLGKNNDDNSKKRKKLTADQKEAARIAKQLETNQAKINGLRTASGKLLTEQKLKLQQLTAAEKEAVKTSTAHEKSLVRMRQKLKELTTAYDNTGKRTKAAAAEINKLSTQIEKAEKATNRHGRGVGGYAKQIKGLAIQFAGALGLTGLIFKFTGAVKKSIGSIVEFDAAMQNIAGITGTSRDELVDVEEAIKDVAGSSIKTSNEVAKLAEVLFTLGKTKEEVVQMLAPVNNLAIGLQATSEEAAELLGQTLNAFGKGSESAAEFADIIANMRTSTALNFDRIKDSLGFLAPTASALNLTLGDTGALIGILQDNGVKAARAGALLNTSFARLVGEGLTLDEALGQINNSTDKVKTSSELFGKRAFGLGLILADNTDRIKTLGNEFDNLSGGSLKKLTDEQLKSISAQIKIADSVWEKWILNIDSGSGVISRVIRGSIKLFIDLLTPIKTATEKFVEQKEKINDLEKNITPLLDRYDELKTKTNLNTEEQKELNTIVGQIGEALPTVITQWDKYGKAIDVSTEAGRRAIEVIQRQNELLNVDAIKEQEDQLSGYDKTIERLNLQLKRGTKTIEVYMGQFGGSVVQEIALTGDEITKLSDTLNSTQLSKEATQATINGLKGIKEEITEIADVPKKGVESDSTVGLTKKEIKARDKLAKKTLEIEKKLQKDLAAIELKRIQDQIDIDADFVEQADRDIIKEAEAVEAAEQRKFDAAATRIKAIADLKKEKAEEEAEEEADKLELKTAIENASFEAAGQISDALTARKVGNLQKEFDVLMLQKEAELSQENLTAEEKQKIEEKFAKKAAVIKTKQAKAEKEGALFSTIINTAKAVVEQGIITPQAIAAGILGALQTGIIAARAVPQFAKGTDFAPGGASELAEQGREMVVNPDGRIWMAENRGLYNLDKGSKVLTHSETKRKEMTDRNIVRGLRRVEKAVLIKNSQNNAVSKSYINQYL